jgi:hypothetical protein
VGGEGEKQKPVKDLIDLFEKKAKPKEKSGQQVKHVLPEIRLVMDAHMHICSGYTIPLPLLWNQMPSGVGLKGQKRTWYDSWGVRPALVRKSFGIAWGLAKNTEDEIGKTAAAENHKTYENQDALKNYRESDSVKRLGMMLAMPMDMEYAHYDGYAGQKVYQKNPVEKDDLLDLQKEFLRKTEQLIDKQKLGQDSAAGKVDHIVQFIKSAAHLLVMAKSIRKYDDKWIKIGSKRPALEETSPQFKKEFVEAAAKLLDKGKQYKHPTITKNDTAFIRQKRLKLDGRRCAGDYIGAAAVILGLMRDCRPDSLIDRALLLEEEKISNALFQMDKEVPSTLTAITVKQEEKAFEFMHNAQVSLGLDADNLGEGDRYCYYDKPQYDEKGEPTNKRTRTLLDKEEFSLFETWKQQVHFTQKAAREFPWEIVPLYHYEPRRWIDRDNQEKWQLPFNLIASSGQNGVFVGFKMYTRLGYRPLDPKLPRMADYYKKCEENKIPVLVHCTRGGMGTHHEKYYLEYEEDDQVKPKYRQKDKNEFDYFAEHFVHPQAWKKVLEKYPKLYLCLAHFGGGDTQWQIDPDEDIDKNTWIKTIIDLLLKYDNFYTDMSYIFLEESIKKFSSAIKKYPKIIGKILYGTDWYMTEINCHRHYDQFCKHSRESITKIFESIKDTQGLPDSIKSADDLWIQLTAVNPFKFHRLSENAKWYLAALKSDPDLYAKNKIKVDNGAKYLKFFFKAHQRKGFFPKNEAFAE